ncbi:MAG: phosphohydrolase [Pseudomonadales bacterium]|uniref:HD domain-containing phosphohydrolase n=1 Tax=unclassified Ketobacter TaxID=2639109 RepID=UPI000C4F77ED|nr:MULTISPECIES: HD domain-containing phosphohydrolase [unclassified Ketobacter]MAA61075.1 phosphohydrolase [Pseudomonadales bacterium]MEC8812734.1 HD domain-containing phosphohydrolase [Pseudomonadota bacterium]HAG92518.1 phosphohydrolase [Gammaproteobacteria bacterium]MAQ22755.1 phosphohydrolase [Pseudomonadales bacterium]MAQ22943.1 phosphohydrolase [Pseudomonadales bacterium]
MNIQIQRKGLRFSIRLTVVGVFALATTLTAVIAIGLQYYFSRSIAIETALGKYQNHAENTRSYLNAIDTNAFHVAQLLARYPQLLSDGEINPDSLQLFSDIMQNNRLFYAIYIGLENGDFFEVVNLNSSNTARRQLKATPQDRWIVIRVSGSGAARQRVFEYYNADMQLRVAHSESSDYDPSVRPWFTNATTDRVFKTDPYLFQHLQAPGQSYSMRLPQQNAVLAVDITLSSLASFLKAQSHNSGSEIYLFKPSGELISSNQTRSAMDSIPSAPPVELSDAQSQFIQSVGKLRISNELDWPPIDYAVSAEPQGYSVDLMRMIAQMTGLQIEFVNGYSWQQLVALFEQGELDILQPVFANDDNRRMGTLSDPFLRLPYAIATRPGQAPITRVSELNGKVVALPNSWSIIQILEQHYPAIQVLPVDTPIAALRAVLDGQAFATLDSAPVLHYTADHYYIDRLQFHENINARADKLPDQMHFLTSTRYPLLNGIINKALSSIDAYHTTQLQKKWFTTADAEAPSQPKTTVPYPELIAPVTGLTNHLHEVNLNGQPHFIYKAALNPEEPDSDLFAVVIGTAELMAPSIARVTYSVAITTLCLLILLPFIWLFAAPIVRPIKRLAIENNRIKNRRYDEVEFHDSSIIEIFELSRSIVDMAATIKQHEEAQKALMESLIQLIAQAIDEKSPYTAGHCARVPELALMLARAAEDCNTPPFDTFRFRNEDEYREFRIGAWLHDCGKITTPEHIVDKGTKLETIYNRIHEIRTRFEVLWRDAEIQYLQAVLDQPQLEPQWQQQLEHKRQQLQDDFHFIARLNQGSEGISPDQTRRLQELAMITWQRHFDDRIGLSPVEALRYSDQAPTLPVTEPLLADKPHHIIEHEKPKTYPAHLQIDMEIPEHLYNLGEVYNLSIARGTLSKEDRFKIQEHMIGTIRMLDALPFPPELSNVPRFASTHHETLKGTGYPRKLNGHQLSIPERIMAVADIYEALTAADRPYKTPKTVSESVAILFRMVESGDIDRDVFELFLSSGVYQEYSARYLQPQQQDDVPINQYLRNRD